MGSWDKGSCLACEKKVDVAYSVVQPVNGITKTHSSILDFLCAPEYDVYISKLESYDDVIIN